MHSKEVTWPTKLTLIAPDSWTAGFKNGQLIYTEHYDNPDSVMLEEIRKVTFALLGPDMHLDPSDDGFRITIEGEAKAFYGILGELLMQMVVRDLIPQETVHAIHALLTLGTHQQPVLGTLPPGQVLHRLPAQTEHPGAPLRAAPPLPVTVGRSKVFDALEDMYGWFTANYKEAQQDAPISELVYPEEELWEQFPDANPDDLATVVRHLAPDGRIWVRNGTNV